MHYRYEVPVPLIPHPPQHTRHNPELRLHRTCEHPCCGGHETGRHLGLRDLPVKQEREPCLRADSNDGRGNDRLAASRGSGCSLQSGVSDSFGCRVYSGEDSVSGNRNCLNILHMQPCRAGQHQLLVLCLPRFPLERLMPYSLGMNSTANAMFVFCHCCYWYYLLLLYNTYYVLLTTATTTAAAAAAAPATACCCCCCCCCCCWLLLPLLQLLMLLLLLTTTTTTTTATNNKNNITITHYCHSSSFPFPLLPPSSSSSYYDDDHGDEDDCSTYYLRHNNRRYDNRQ